MLLRHRIQRRARTCAVRVSGLVTFALNKDGKVERVTMKPVSPMADFSWDYQDLSFTPVKGAK